MTKPNTDKPDNGEKLTMSDDLSDLHPDTVNPATLVDRLRGYYRLPIKDGLGPVKGGDEPDNPKEYVRTFGPVPPIQRVAAAEIERLRAALDAAQADNAAWHKAGAAMLEARDAALAARDAAWRAGRDAGFEAGCEHGHDVATADARGYTPEFTREERIRALQPPADLAAEAPGDAVPLGDAMAIAIKRMLLLDIPPAPDGAAAQALADWQKLRAGAGA